MTYVKLICGHGYSHAGPPSADEMRTIDQPDPTVWCEKCKMDVLIVDVTVQLP